MNSIDTSELDVTGQTKWVDDGRGGHVLRAWTEGRLWSHKSVQRHMPVLLHAVGCDRCSWNKFSIELCTPGLRIIEDRIAPA